ncbi:MAG TPA: DUF2795 domain-containing protein [Mycobacteriales bacterium]|nr:DUF2795 domain-containing protein [Mycobacteriales bacterium]
MERGTKHGFRIDDAMDHETESLQRAGHESRVEEYREMEPAGEDQPVPDGILSGDPYPVDSDGPALPHDAIEARSELAKHLRVSAWPADRETLLSIARDENAPAAVIAMLEKLPWSSEQYENLAAVWTAIGGPVEQSRS